MKLLKNTIILIFSLCVACNSAENKNMKTVEKQPAKVVQNYKDYEIINIYDTDPSAFVQGLIYKNGLLYLSTGLVEHSSLRLIDFKAGTELKNIKIPEYFCEGIGIIKDKIYQLTWQDGECLVYDAKTFKQIKTFNYKGEGWGFATNNDELIMSDGTNRLKFINPDNFNIIKTLDVTDEKGYPIYNLNELEYAEGLIWANIWTDDYVVAINPETGVVVRKIDLSELRSKLGDNKYAEVLNGIAYNPESKTFYFTGKFWGKVFELKLK